MDPVSSQLAYQAVHSALSPVLEAERSQLALQVVTASPSHSVWRLCTPIAISWQVASSPVYFGLSSTDLS